MTLPVTFYATVMINCWRFITWLRGIEGFRSTFGGFSGERWVDNVFDGWG
jgi:hypothetical protein